MDFKKIFTSKTGIAVIFVIITVLAVLGFSVICKRGGSYMFRDRRGEVKENFQNGEKVFDLSENENVKIVNEGQLIFDGISIDDVYKVNDKQYHIIADNNKVVVDDKESFSTEEELFKIHLYRDILLIQVKRSSGVDLFFVDMNGNFIKKIEKAKLVDVSGLDVLYSFEVAGNDGINMYDGSYRNVNRITYLGDYNFSDVSSVEYYQPGCDTSDYCMIYGKNGLKVEYISEHFEHSKINSHYSLFVNGKNVEIGIHLSSIFLLSDNYLLVSSSYMDGWSNFINIVDSNGNVVVEFGDYMNDDEYTAYHLVSGDNVYNNGEITIYSVIYDKFDRYYEDSCSAINDDKSTVIGRKRVFKYLGNGKVDDQIIVKNITLGDWITQLNCEQR